MAGVTHSVKIPLHTGAYATGLEGVETLESIDDRIELKGPGGTPFPTHTHNLDSPGWADYCVRVVIPAAALALNASNIKLTLEAHGTENTLLDNVYIGHQGAGDVWDYDGNQVEVLFSAGSGVDITAGGTATSDITGFALDSSKDLVIGVNIGSNAAKDGLRRDSAAPANYYESFKAASNEAGDTAPAGFAATATTFAIVSKIEGVYSITSPATTGTWTALPKGTLDMSTARCVVFKDDVVQAATSTDVKFRYYANGGAASSWLTATDLRAETDVVVTDTTRSIKIESQYISDGDYQSASRAFVVMNITPLPAGAFGNQVF